MMNIYQTALILLAFALRSASFILLGVQLLKDLERDFSRVSVGWEELSSENAFRRQQRDARASMLKISGTWNCTYKGETHVSFWGVS